MAADFDPADKDSWYFGPLSRGETNEILMSVRDSGVFLVRDSNTIRGDFVLCVKEGSKVSHYIINKIQTGSQIMFRIGDQEFPDLPNLLNFYKTHYLDTTSLIRTAPKETVIARFDFGGRDPEDLPFTKGEILTILTKDEDQWWNARNSEGKTGLIPVPYVQKYDAEMERRLQEQKRHEQHQQQNQTNEYREPKISNVPAGLQNGQRKLPAQARVVQNREPNAYDKTALKLQVGDVILVTACNINGEWEGELNGKKGVFPFTHVRFIDDPEHPDEDA